MRLRVLGRVALASAGGDPVAVRGARVRALLALLAVRCASAVSADGLIDSLWGDDPPAGAANALQALVSRLRRVLAEVDLADRLETLPGAYRLAVDPEDVDVACFERLAATGRGELAAGDTEAAAGTLRSALGLWRGAALEDVRDTPLLAAEALRLEELRLATLEDRIAADLAQGGHAELVGELQQLVASHPLRERLREHLMVALYGAGRQADALAVYDDTRRTLAEDLGVDPGPALRRLHEQILRQDPALGSGPARPPAAPPARTNLRGPLTSFVGRAREVTELERLLGPHRLVTLYGPGGVGKSRLAVETALRLADRYPDGAWLVELATLGEERLLAAAVGEALGLRELTDLSAGGRAPQHDSARLAEHLRSRELLLVVDNCEHLVEGVGRLLEELLLSCPGLHALATSREPLGLAGEATLAVPPLPVPETRESELLERTDAVQLFCERAGAAQPRLELSEAALVAAAEICRRLDGLPLAIELAASRARTMPLHEIAARLEDRFRLLTGGARTAEARQRTLRAAVDWSYDLLDDAERLVFARLAVFAGSFTLDEATAVAAASSVRREDVLIYLTRLVERSLVQGEQAPAGPARYRLLETLRAYGRERLTELAEADPTLERHARLMAAIAEEADPQLRGAEQATYLDVLDRHQDDFRGALAWAAERDHELSLRLAAGLWWFWWLRGHYREGVQWCEAALARDRSATPARARVLTCAGLLAAWQGELEHAQDRCAAAVELSERIGDAAGAAFGLLAAATVAGMRYDLDGAATHLHGAQQAFAAVGDPWGLAVTHYIRGLAAQALARRDDAEAAAQAALEGFRESGDRWGAAAALDLLGHLAETRGDYATAVDCLEQCQAAARELGLGWLATNAQGRLANLAMLTGDHTRARTLHERNLVEARAVGCDNSLALSLNGLGMLAYREGDLDEAEQLHRQALDRYVPPSREAGRALSLCCLGFVAEQRGDPERAARLHHEALALTVPGGDLLGSALAVEGYAGAAGAAGDHERAARLLGLAAALRAQAGAPLPDAERGDVDRIEERSRRALGDQAFDRAFASGGEQTLDDALSAVRQ